MDVLKNSGFHWMMWLKKAHDLPLGTALLLVLAVSVAAGLFNHLAVTRPMINDEAVELLQGVDMPVNGFHFFTPDYVYPEGFADIIETFVPYINRALSGHFFGFESQESLTLAIRSYFGLAYVAGVLLFTLAVGRLWGGWWAVAGGVCLGLSAFTLILNQFLTRNGISILWSTALVLLLVFRMEGNKESFFKRKVVISILMACVLVLGCWTYTSFRLLTLAFYLALLLDWFRFDRTLKTFTLLGVSGTTFVCILGLLVVLGGVSPMLFLQRGGYAMGEVNHYFNLLMLSLLSPLYHATGQNPFFLVEDIHNLVQRPVLSLWLAPFFVLGWLVSWRWGGRLMSVVVLTYTAGMALCALAGPSAKYLFVFFPFTIVLSLVGLRTGYEWLKKVPLVRKIRPVVATFFLVGMASGEIRELSVRFREDDDHVRNATAELLAKTALEYLELGGTVYVLPGLGCDIVMWKTRAGRNTGRLFVCRRMDDFRKLVEQGISRKGAVLLVDYPVDCETLQLNGWTFPEQVRIINVSAGQATR